MICYICINASAGGSDVPWRYSPVIKGTIGWHFPFLRLGPTQIMRVVAKDPAYTNIDQYNLISGGFFYLFNTLHYILKVAGIRPSERQRGLWGLFVKSGDFNFQNPKSVALLFCVNTFVSIAFVFFKKKG